MNVFEVPDWFRKVMLDNGFRSYSPPIMDAEPMSRDEIIRRREQGLYQHLLFTGQLLRAALMRAPKPSDQEELWQDIADSFYPSNPIT